jgi:hypothetical protein
VFQFTNKFFFFNDLLIYYCIKNSSCFFHSILEIVTWIVCFSKSVNKTKQKQLKKKKKRLNGLLYTWLCEQSKACMVYGLYSLRNRPEKLVQINFIFTNNVRIFVYIDVTFPNKNTAVKCFNSQTSFFFLMIYSFTNA